MITRPVITGAATLVAAAALAYGGWSLFAVLSTPAPAPVVFAALTPPTASASPLADTPAVPLAAVFGEPGLRDEPLDPLPEPADLQPEGQPWEPDPFFDDAFFLRGVIVGETGAMAILETPDGTQIVREGTVLPTGEEVLTIGPDSVEILVGDEMFSISFADDMMDAMADDFDDMMDPMR